MEMLPTKSKKPEPADLPIAVDGVPETPQNAVGEPLAEGAEASFAVNACGMSNVECRMPSVE